MNNRFEGRTVVVTGAGGGLGCDLARGFAAEGAELILTDMDQTLLTATESELQKAGVKCSAYLLDLSVESDIHQVAKTIGYSHQNIHVLINNAGIAFGEISQSFAELNQTQWLYYLSVNSVAPVLLAQALRAPLANAKGVVLNQSSMMSYVPTIAYGVTKAALNAMTYGMAQAFASDNIRVNGIAPGYIDTPAAHANGTEATRAYLLNMQAVKTTGSTDDIVKLARFLASDDARFITGETISCDGGSTMKGWRA